MRAFGKWFNAQPHKHKIVVPGNHDMILDEGYYADYWSDWSSVREDPAEARAALAPATILHDAAVTIEGVTIAWEIAKYNAPANSMVPQTLMAFFACSISESSAV